ncbi:MAG TPA: tetratricopeptide repeat protein [Planctomycetota bacterium]|nr:tetratricopeptide repeat protein [Planctomycetota bacterium]
MSNSVLNLVKKARATGLLAVLGKDGPASGIADLGAIRVSGPDAAAFLHSQLTNEVKALKPGEGNLSARVTRTGTLVRWFSLHALPDNSGFLLLLEREGIPTLLADLGKYAIIDDVQLADVSDDYEWLALQGSSAPAIAESALGKIGSESWADLAECAVRPLPAGALGFCRSLTGDSGFVLGIPRETGDSAMVFERLRETPQSKDLLVLSGAELADVLEVMRIEAGIVRVGVDAPEGKYVLPETGLESQVVSYSKGCYLGQEVIARIRTYGSLPNVLRGMIFDMPPAAPEVTLNARAEGILQKLPDAGADLLLEDGKKVGFITSRTHSPVLEAPVAYAYLDRANRMPGTKLKLKGKSDAIVTATVTLLPFYKASDLKARVTFLHDRAIRLFAEEQDDKAIALLEEALRLDPTFADGYEALGVILGRKSRFNEAIEIFKRLEDVAPNEPMVHTNLSLFYMKLGDKVAAEEEKAKATVKQFSRFGALKKDEQRAAEELQKKRDDALRKKAMFEEVLEIDPEDPIALFGLGNALSALDDYASAEAALARATRADKDNSAVYLAHGKVLEMLNREADALRVYREGMAVASRKGDLMPLKEMERRSVLLERSK